jgi:hypothetical protein
MCPLVSFGSSLGGEAEIQVGVSRQDAGGKTQKDFTIDFLNNFESFTVERLKVKTRESMAEKGFPNAEVNLSSGAVFVEYGSVKLAVVKINLFDLSHQVIANQVFVAGIRDNQLIRLACTRKSAKVIPISYGACGDKISEVFGIKLLN